MKVINETQQEAILDAISNLTEIDTWDDKIIHIYFSNGKWITETEESLSDN